MCRWSAVAGFVAVAIQCWAWGARGEDVSAAAASCGSFDGSHAAWTKLLHRYVHDGRVDYAGLKEHGEPALDAYLHSLESVCPADYAKWSRAEKLAFFINAYNAFTVKLILEHYPVDSIHRIGLVPGAAFRESFIPLQRLRGKTLSLDDVEHHILRGELHEPRVHFAIVCASRSCPALRSEAYRASELDEQLDSAARRFVQDGSKNRYVASKGTLFLSRIFDWYREDFERVAPSLLAFVARYADPHTATAIAAGDVRVRFLDYDWSLNGD